MLQTVSYINSNPIKYDSHKILTYVSYFDGKEWFLAADRWISLWGSSFGGKSCFSLVLVDGSLFYSSSYEELISKYKTKFGMSIYEGSDM